MLNEAENEILRKRRERKVKEMDKKHCPFDHSEKCMKEICAIYIDSRLFTGCSIEAIAQK